MKLTAQVLRKLIVEAMESRQVVLKLQSGNVVLDIPKGFSKRKDGPDRSDSSLHQIVIVTNDRRKMMDISYDYEVEDVQINIFVRDPVDKILDYRGGHLVPAGSPSEVIRRKFNELMEKLKKEQ